MSTFHMPYPYHRHLPDIVAVGSSLDIKKIRPKLYSESLDFKIIIGLTAVLMAVFLITVLINPVITAMSGFTSATAKCRDLILGYERSGIYSSQQEFRNAISYC